MKRWLTTSCLVLLMSMLGILLGACSAAIAQLAIPVIPTGLPWEAIGIGGVVILQGTQIVIQFASRTTTGARQSEIDMRAETKDLAKQLQVETRQLGIDLREKTAATDALLAHEIKDIHRSIATLSGSVHAIAAGIVGAVNDNRLRMFDSEAACARRHNEPASKRPTLVTVPSLRQPVGGHDD